METTVVVVHPQIGTQNSPVEFEGVGPEQKAARPTIIKL